MAILASELFAQGPGSSPSDDTLPSGGALGQFGAPFLVGGTYFGMTQPASPSILEVLSDDAGDSQDITVIGRDSGGVVQTEIGTLNGTTAVILGSTIFEYVQSIFIDAPYTGNIIVRLSVAGVTVGTLPDFPQMFGRVSMFKNSFSDALSIKIRYEKMFWRMSSAGEILTSAEVELIADPLSRIRQGIALAINDTTFVANRLITPPGVTFVDDSVAQSVPGGDLGAGDVIGVWYEQNLPAGDPANVSTFTTQLSGQDIP